MSEQPFTLSVPDADIALLRQKLSLARFPDELAEDAGWDYGAPLGDVRRLTERWRDAFDWRAAEKTINELPMFTRDIEVDGHGTLNVHYVHQKNDVEAAVPLLFVHGWPGHFMEVQKILPLLTAKSENPSQPNFHVVALSLPGFGFSEAPKKKKFMIPQFAETGHKLMLALGYQRYVVQGGDWGSAISRSIASKYGPKHAQAWHTNMPWAQPPRFRSSPLLYLQNLVTPQPSQDVPMRRRAEDWNTRGHGYFAIQQSKPQTLGFSMADSPVGLLAWVYEKLVAWSDEYPWEDDEVLWWVSIYWFSRAGPTAATRIYYEYANNFAASNPPRSTVPMGISRFPKEITYASTLWLKAIGNPVFESSHPSGGHFAAWERPHELVDDIRKMFGKDVVTRAFK